MAQQTCLGRPPKMERLPCRFNYNMRRKLLIKGIGASPGRAEGKVVVITNMAEFSKMKQGRILVAPITNPSWLLVMQKAAAIITDYGGALSHPAIVCREFGIPAVVSTQKATKVLKNGMRVVVDGKRGKVYEK